MVSEKICTTCKSLKKIDEFYPRADQPNHYRSECKECHTAKGLARYHGDTKVKARRRVSSRKHVVTKVYGLTLAEYEDLVNLRSGRCHVCEAPPSPHRHHSIDHDHTTGKVRGLLCRNCNSALGYAKDSPLTLRALATYLENSRATDSGYGDEWVAG